MRGFAISCLSLLASTLFASYELPQYVAQCQAELGMIPSFTCQDGQEVKITDSDHGGREVTYANHSGFYQKCDRPTLLRKDRENWWTGINPCTPHMRIGREKAEHGFETEWIWTCRRYFVRSRYNDYFDDVNMIGHNPKTGATCFFVSRLNRTKPETGKKDPGIWGRDVPSPASQQGISFWKSPKQMDGQSQIFGGSQRCTHCHDSDVWVHSPFIDQVKTDSGEPIVPSQPNGKYWAVGTQYFNKREWQPLHLVSREAQACTRCHRIGNQRSCADFATMAVGKSTMAHITTSFQLAPFMPSSGDASELKPHVLGEEKRTVDERYLKAVEFINACCKTPTAKGCQWEEMPR